MPDKGLFVFVFLNDDVKVKCTLVRACRMPLLIRKDAGGLIEGHTHMWSRSVGQG